MIRESFAIGDPPDIEIRIESGRVEIHEGPGGSVDVRADGATAGIIVEQIGNSIVVATDPVATWSDRGAVSVVITTPAGSDLKIAVASADVSVGVDVDRVDLKSASGDIEIRQVGTMVAKTASGDVRIEEVKRSLRFTSASGDIEVDRAAGSVVVSTASGDIVIEDCEATLEVNSASGDTRVERFTGRNANFKAMSGGASLGIPSGSSVDLDVSLRSGRLIVPDSERRQGPAERTISISARFVSGDLVIDRV